jgi:TPR repeat protein
MKIFSLFIFSLLSFSNFTFAMEDQLPPKNSDKSSLAFFKKEEGRVWSLAATLEEKESLRTLTRTNGEKEEPWEEEEINDLSPLQLLPPEVKGKIFSFVCAGPHGTRMWRSFYNTAPWIREILEDKVFFNIEVFPFLSRKFLPLEDKNASLSYKLRVFDWGKKIKKLQAPVQSQELLDVYREGLRAHDPSFSSPYLISSISPFMAFKEGEYGEDGDETMNLLHQKRKEVALFLAQQIKERKEEGRNPLHLEKALARIYWSLPPEKRKELGMKETEEKADQVRDILKEKKNKEDLAEALEAASLPTFFFRCISRSLLEEDGMKLMGFLVERKNRIDEFYYAIGCKNRGEEEGCKTYLERAASKGHRLSQWVLMGAAVEEKNSIKVVEWAHKLANQGFPMACLIAGNDYRDLKNPNRDLKKAFSLFKIAAEAGYFAGQYRAGKLYLKGKGVEEDKVKGLRWLQEAAKQGLPEAQYDLGQFYVKGRWVAKDKVKAVEWFIKAADQGHASAQCELGACYFTGYGTEKDTIKAFEYLKKAAGQGHASAQCELGVCYFNGRGVEKDAIKAVEWFQKAAEQGHAQAQCELGACYFTGYGTEKDDVTAVEWVQKAAEQGHAQAQCELGACYFTGYGTEKDAIKAFEWVQKAAVQGHAQAQCHLGMFYFTGQGVGKDDITAVEWVQKAAEQGHAQAQCCLGMLYLNGQGVKDDVKAFEWVQKAAEEGHAEAQCCLGMLYLNGQGVEKDAIKAFEWVQKAAEQGHPFALLTQAFQYFNGLGVEKNLEKAAAAVQSLPLETRKEYCMERGIQETHPFYLWVMGVPVKEASSQESKEESEKEKEN